MRGFVWIAFPVAVTAILAIAVVLGLIIPGYTNPSSRLYTSRFGYPELLRAQGRPFPVTTARPERRVLSRTFLGEGVVRSEPILVPIVPMGRILSVRVAEGEPVRKGQLLAEVDPNRALINLEAARWALETAKAELERTRIGSSYILKYERPKSEAIRLDAAKQSVATFDKILAMQERLTSRGYHFPLLLFEQQMNAIQLRAEARQAEFTLGMAEQGKEQSLQIGEQAVHEAELAQRLRTSELEDYRVYSPVDGVVERCLVHAGEYNQAMGRPAFLVATGAWFEAQFDQTTFGRFRVGDRAEVRLEAQSDRVYGGKIVMIYPFVSYNLGGPETDRPIRPLGTGAPEWPATYAVRIQVDDPEISPEIPLVPGLTGFARVMLQSESLAIPREGVAAVSGGRGMAYVVRGATFSAQGVTLGVTDGDWTGIRSGLKPDDEVIVDGHYALMPGDRITVTRRERRGD
jgi:multidrug efflux pump subunit AcrA (membrane-fusion protein)